MRWGGTSASAWCRPSGPRSWPVGGGVVKPPPGGWPARLGNPTSAIKTWVFFFKNVIRRSVLRNQFISKLRCGWWRRTCPFRAGADGLLRLPQPAESSLSAWPSGGGALVCTPLLSTIPYHLGGAEHLHPHLLLANTLVGFTALAPNDKFWGVCRSFSVCAPEQRPQLLRSSEGFN